jgi:hypothetical protein
VSAIVKATDVIDLDLTEAIDDAQEQQAKAEEIAARFDQVAADLADFAAFVRVNPDLAKHMRNTGMQYGSDRALAYVHGAETLAEFARAAARAGRKVTKKTNGTEDQFFGIEVSFGWLTLYVYADRDEVCERVVTGSREVVEEVPDPEALAAVPKVTVTTTVEDVVWRCGPLLAPVAEHAVRAER